MTTRQVFFIADGFQALDLFGPLDAFMETNTFSPHAYEAQLLSRSGATVSTAHGQLVQPDLCLEDDFELDDLIICGGVGMRTLTLEENEFHRLKSIAQRAKRVFSICTGAFILAKLFPNEHIAITSHWRHCDELSKQNPEVTVHCEPLFVKSGNKWSSAGILSGVDLALAIIKDDHGNAIAAKVAKELVIYLKRTGSQNQFSDMLKLQAGESFKLSPLIDWLTQNIHRQITVSEMADHVHLSERQLTRLFKQHLNCTPSSYFRKIKLNYARDLLGEENISVEHVAYRTGFSSYDSFRRAFFRQFSISPTSHAQGIKI